MQRSLAPRSQGQRLLTPAGSRPAAPPRVAARVLNGDGSARVKGDVQRVFLYVSDLTAWPSWYPGISSVTRTSGMGAPCATRGTRFVLEQTLAGWKGLTTYEVADAEDCRRLVYSGIGKMHTTTDQFIFMPDPNDPSFTIVRYVSNIKLQGGAAALQPVVSGVLSKVPEEAMSKLSRLLSSAKTPLASIKLPSKQETRQKQAASADARKAQAGAGSQGSAASSRRKDSSNLFQSLGSIWNSLGSTASGSSMDGPSAEEEAAAAADSQLDPRRYYRALGLDPAARDSLGPDEVKAAFRKLAQTMHPDKAVGVSEARKAAAEVAFKAVQEAYEVLRNPETKRAYDEGKMREGEGAAAGSR